MGNKLLLADDSITIQKVVGIIFANEDYELTIVDNGNAALEKAAALRPDVMLVDAIMPGKSGYEVCEAVRRDPALKATPILLLTGAFEPFDEEKARQSGADDFISKPFESQHLIEKVKALRELGRERTVAPAAAAPAAPEPAFAEAPAAPAADIWGEVPAAEPLAFEAAPVAEPPAAPELADAFSFADVNVEEEAYVTEVVAAEETAAPPAEDDLWGAFELEEVPAGEEAEFATVVEVEEVAPAVGAAEFEPFSFEEEEVPAPAVPEPSFAAGYPEESANWLPEGEQTFSFEETPAAGEAVSFADVNPFVAEVEEPVAAPPAAPQEPSEFAIEFEAGPAAPPEPVVEAPAAPAVEPLPPPVAPAAAAPPAGEMTLSEDQLAALVARISRDIIEKIAWEVVPDLAETLIREEIRKIKEGR